ncbi:MAG: type II toxin-antitoxin system RelE/ParE family toxin [Bacillota bacterium]
MKYRIQRTDKANDQLYSLIQYIADDSGDIDLALKYLDKIEEAVMRLVSFPYSGTTPRYSILKKQGYRVLNFEKQLVFYKVDDDSETVTIHAVVDGRMEYRNLI